AQCSIQLSYGRLRSTPGKCNGCAQNGKRRGTGHADGSDLRAGRKKFGPGAFRPPAELVTARDSNGNGAACQLGLGIVLTVGVLDLQINAVKVWRNTPLASFAFDGAIATLQNPFPPGIEPLPLALTLR